RRVVGHDAEEAAAAGAAVDHLIERQVVGAAGDAAERGLVHAPESTPKPAAVWARTATAKAGAVPAHMGPSSSNARGRGCADPAQVVRGSRTACARSCSWPSSCRPAPR